MHLRVENDAARNFTDAHFEIIDIITFVHSERFEMNLFSSDQSNQRSKKDE